MKYLEEMHNLQSATSREEVEQSYPKIAEALLYNSLLVINGVHHKICEIEFYYKSGVFQDPFIHRDQARQKLTNEWYLHRLGSGFKGGNYKGIDLTFGSKESHGGILIRGIENLETGAYVGRSSKVVDTILSLMNAKEVKELASNVEAISPNDANSPLRIIPNNDVPDKKPVASPRVGLTLIEENFESRLSFIMKNFRYIADPSKAERDKHTIFLALIKDGLTPGEAAGKVEIRNAEAQKYLQSFELGKSKRPEEFKNVDLKTYTLCELMGALS